MKDQYIADIGDYGKYSLLKAFADAGVKVGINWYYTERDGSSDGKHTKYLETGDLSALCPEVFYPLKSLFKNDRTIEGFERKNILKDAVYFNEKMKFTGAPAQRKEQRRVWFERSIRDLCSSELIFMDPDNGLSVQENKSHLEKYILPVEIERLYADHNIVYYCHRGRRTDKQWEQYKATMFMRIPGAIPIVLTFHKGTQRSYVFLIHPKDYNKYKATINSFMETWSKDDIFTEESINLQNMEAIHGFALKWLKVFRDNPDFYRIFDATDLSDDAKALGFVMDSGESFEEAFPWVGSLGDLAAAKELASGNYGITPQLIGAAVHSQWRYWNHWSYGHPQREDYEWFEIMLELLAKRCTSVFSQFVQETDGE